MRKRPVQCDKTVLKEGESFACIILKVDGELLMNVKDISQEKIFKYDAAHQRFLDDDRQHFASYDFEDVMGISSFSETMNALKVLSSMIQTETMDKIFPTVWKLLCKYHWNFMKNDRANLSVLLYN